ncbi:MAG: hypothetical protein Q27BB25_10440 [Blastomonas sp. CACIA14H2]|nr:MAG: hypothetical protein Q27BB25_10440 [Blastomonas sp. CACIA14H2]
MQPLRLHAIAGPGQIIMEYRLSPDMRCCTIGTHSVFLDLSRDRYFLLSEDAEVRFRKFREGRADEADLAWLVSRRIICPDAHEPADSVPAVPAPESSALDNDLPSARFVCTARAAFAQISARRDIRHRPIARILSEIHTVRERHIPDEHQHALYVASAFQQARYLISGTDQCLPRGIAMKRMLARQGCHADLVIGVTLPFSAHCWVQLGSTVLTDFLDLVQAYKTILVA